MKRRCAVFAVALSIAGAAPSPALADDPAPSSDVSRAESYAAEAFEAYSRKDYTEAVVLYLKALEAAPSSDILYNLAKIYDTKLKDRELAMKFYRRYIADPGADPERVREANERLTELRALEVAASEKPAPVSPQTAPQHGSDRQPDERRLPPPEREGGISGVQAAGIVTGLVGLGGLAVGTVFGLSAKADADTAKQSCDGNDCRTAAGVEAAEDASRKATISTIGFAAGGALTLVGTILLVSGSKGSPERDAATLRMVPYAGPGSLGTQLSGRW
jgi:tetratricopeptide (TPR) repeat protein